MVVRIIPRRGVGRTHWDLQCMTVAIRQLLIERMAQFRMAHFLELDGLVGHLHFYVDLCRPLRRCSVMSGEESRSKSKNASENRKRKRDDFTIKENNSHNYRGAL